MLSTVGLLPLLVQLVVAGIIIYAVYLFLGMLNLPQPIKTIILLIVAVIGLIFLARLFGIAV